MTAFWCGHGDRGCPTPNDKTLKRPSEPFPSFVRNTSVLVLELHARPRAEQNRDILLFEPDTNINKESYTPKPAFIGILLCSLPNTRSSTESTSLSRCHCLRMRFENCFNASSPQLRCGFPNQTSPHSFLPKGHICGVTGRA